MSWFFARARGLFPRKLFGNSSFVVAIACYLKPLHQLAAETANGIGKIAVAQAGKCRTIPFAPERIKNFEARSAIGKKRKSPKC